MRAWLVAAVLLHSGCADENVGDGTGDATTAASSGEPSATTMADDTAAVGSSGTTAFGASTDEASGPGPGTAATFGVDTCGDGRVDSGEECDDGNANDGDTCSSRCTLPFEILWTVAHDGGAGGFDRAEAVVEGDAGIYVLGSEIPAEGGQRLWLQHYDADGAPGWTLTSTGPDDLGASGRNLAWMPDGDLAVVGHAVMDATGRDALVMRVDPSVPAIVWSRTFDGSGAEAEPGDGDSATAVAIDADGNLVLVGEVSVDGEGDDVWVAELTSDGDLRWTETWNAGAGAQEYARTLALRADGTVEAVMIETSDMAGPLPSRVLVFDDEGVPQPEQEVDLGAVVLGIAVLEGDERLTAGSSESGFVAVTRTDAAWAPQWIAMGPPGAVAGVGHGGDAVYAAGQMLEPGGQNAWLGAFAPDGSLVWSDTYDGSRPNQSAWFDLVVDDVGDVIVVGFEATADESINAMIRKYRPY